MKNDPGFVHISPFLPVNFRFSIVGVWKDAFEPAKRAAPMTRGHAMSAKRTLDMRFLQTRNMTLQSARSSRPLVASVPVPAVRTPCASTKPGCESLGIHCKTAPGTACRTRFAWQLWSHAGLQDPQKGCAWAWAKP